MAELMTEFPGLQPSRLSAEEWHSAQKTHQAALPAEIFTRRSADLHDELLVGSGLRGTREYNAKLTELEDELAAGPGGAGSRAAASPGGISERRDIRSAKSIGIGSRLLQMKPGDPDRRALVGEYQASLDADQAAAEAGSQHV